VESNPVRKVAGFTTADALLRWDDIFLRGVSLSLGIENLFDRRYAHPGVRDANAGVDPGAFDSNGQWAGSHGFYSSLLPQPGRSIALNLHIDSPALRRRSGGTN
jgi:outer membrane receptor protein involved in Fe transport